MFEKPMDHHALLRASHDRLRLRGQLDAPRFRQPGHLIDERRRQLRRALTERAGFRFHHWTTADCVPSILESGLRARRETRTLWRQRSGRCVPLYRMLPGLPGREALLEAYTVLAFQAAPGTRLAMDRDARIEVSPAVAFTPDSRWTDRRLDGAFWVNRFDTAWDQELPADRCRVDVPTLTAWMDEAASRSAGYHHELWVLGGADPGMFTRIVLRPSVRESALLRIVAAALPLGIEVVVDPALQSRA